MENNNQVEESKTDGFELLEKVIKSNEENIKSNEDKIKLYVKLRFMFEDHLTMMGHTQLDFGVVAETYKDAMKFYEVESVKRSEFLKNFPTKIEAVLAPETIERFEKIDSFKNKRNKNFFMVPNRNNDFSDSNISYFYQLCYELV